MPPVTSIAKFRQTLRTRKSDIMKVLDDLFANPLNFRGDYPNAFTRLRDDENALDSLAWADNILRPLFKAAPLCLSDQEVDRAIGHINDWPNDQKNRVRETLVYAITDAASLNRPVCFFWELYDGTNEDIDIDNPVPPSPWDAITMTFRSPRQNVTKDDVTGDITVGVGRGQARAKV